jgi:hypothetical protein
MNTSQLTFDIFPSDATNPLGVEVWVNDQQIADFQALDQLQHITHVFDDEIEQDHRVKIIVKNKTPTHTHVNEAGEILQDSLVNINNFKIDEIDIDQVVYQKAVYAHDFNGSGNQVADSFYGPAGCNGSIELEFSTPAYLWLLENT